MGEGLGVVMQQRNRGMVVADIRDWGRAERWGRKREMGDVGGIGSDILRPSRGEERKKGWGFRSVTPSVWLDHREVKKKAKPLPSSTSRQAQGPKKEIFGVV